MNWLDILLVLFFLAAFFHLLYLILYIFPLKRCIDKDKVNKNSALSTQSVAVIIAARNEETSIADLLEALISQTYQNYEIHVIDDYSDDNTAEIIRLYAEKYPIIHYHRNTSAQGKKYALRSGIESVDASILLFTDADCRPISQNWIQSMVNRLGKQEICLGYGKYESRDGFLNIFIQFETGIIASQYMAFALRRHPYMGVGRNLVYRKSVFMQSDKFKEHESLRSGDDDLFIMQNADGKNTAINLQPDSFTVSEAPKSWWELIMQKRRHLSTSPEYTFPIQVRLIIISLSNMYFYIIGLIIGIFFPTALPIILLSTGVKWLLDILCYRRIFHRLIISRSLYFFPILDIALSIYYFILAPFLIFRKTDTW